MTTLVVLALIVYGISRAAKYAKENPEKAKRAGKTLKDMFVS